MSDPRRHPDGLARIEVRSIDHIPPGERHSRVTDQFSLWFALNANTFPVVLGGVVIFIGLNFLWACSAIILEAPVATARSGRAGGRARPRRRAERRVRDRTRAKWASAARGASAGGTGWSAGALRRPARGGGWR